MTIVILIDLFFIIHTKDTIYSHYTFTILEITLLALLRPLFLVSYSFFLHFNVSFRFCQGMYCFLLHLKKTAPQGTILLVGVFLQNISFTSQELCKISLEKPSEVDISSLSIISFSYGLENSVCLS